MVEIHLKNSLTRRVERFEPAVPGKVSMYLCGPTVYDRAHIGNARSAVVFDQLYRLLRHVYGPENVTFVRNFTDVDDKINARAAETGRPIAEITAETTQWYLDDMGALGVMEPTHMPRATAYIAEMVAFIEDLIAKGHAYAAEGHVLFSVASYAEYGKLSGRSTDDMIAGARVEVAPYKRDPMDFVLWKPSSADLPGWDSPWGRGRPGWHIECSAMSHAILGEEFDIHAGGTDLLFPHHENEIAQSCGAGHPFARLWMHNEMLQVEGKKMSKSLGNFFTVRDLLDRGIPGEVIRLVMLGTHYGKPMDWTERKVEDAREELAHWANTLSIRPDVLAEEETISSPAKDVIAALADDLNTSLALTAIRRLAKHIDNSPEYLSLSDAEQQSVDRQFISTVEFLGIPIRDLARKKRKDGLSLSTIEAKFQSTRDKAMQTKDFSAVDALKSALIEAGVEVRMSKAGVELIPGPDFDAAKLEGL